MEWNEKEVIAKEREGGREDEKGTDNDVFEGSLFCLYDKTTVCEEQYLKRIPPCVYLHQMV